MSLTNINKSGGVKLSIVIVSYNTCDVTDNCLRSIENATWPFGYEVIVVDNNSYDGSVAMIREKHPQVRLIANPDNRYFAIANNQGAQIANGDYLLLLNSDTMIENDNIAGLVQYYETLPYDVICVGPKVLNADRTLQSQGFKSVTTHWSTFVKHFNIDAFLPACIGKRILPAGTYRFNANYPHQVSWVVGACMLCRRDLYMKVGGLNEKLEFYGEEPEFGYRTSKLGYKTYYNPNYHIIHLGGASTKPATDSEADREKSLRRYSALVQQTTGYAHAINTSRITLLSYRLKYLISRRPNIKRLIADEKKVLKHLKRLNKS